jgi:hypothetical protein
MTTLPPPPILTRLVTIEFETGPGSAEWTAEVIEKRSRMTIQRRTDGNMPLIAAGGPFIQTLKFIDQDSAEEWQAFITALAARYGRTIISNTITNL